MSGILDGHDMPFLPIYDLTGGFRRDLKPALQRASQELSENHCLLAVGQILSELLAFLCTCPAIGDLSLVKYINRVYNVKNWHC